MEISQRHEADFEVCFNTPGLNLKPWSTRTQREAPKDLSTDEGTETTCVVSVSILGMPSTPESGTPRGKIPALPIHSPLLSVAAPRSLLSGVSATSFPNCSTKAQANTENLGFENEIHSPPGPCLP